MSRGVRWLFTLNNYSEEEYGRCQEFIKSVCRYGIIGKEKGESGTPHLQGYFELRQRHRLSQLKGAVSDRAHFELARGSGDDNRTYCSKEGDVWDHGVQSSYRRRSGESGNNRPTRDDVGKEFAELLSTSAHAGVVDFAAKYPGTWYFSGHNMLRNFIGLTPPVERPDIKVSWYYGPPGTGKSRKAHELMPNAYLKDARTKWWNGYLFQRDVIIDDFGPQGIDITRLLVWFDRYKCTVETKGGMCALLADNFIVTSNFHPHDVFKCIMGEEHPQLPALLRRIVLLPF